MNETQLKRFIYRSRLVADVTCVSDILKTARPFNAINGISGVLIFDGERFVQYIEGQPEVIDALVARLKVDPRHTDFETLGESTPHTDRQFTSWSMGYCALDEDGPYSLLDFNAATSFDQLMQMVPSLDIA